MCVMEPNILVFASGNLVHFFHVDTNVVTTRRSVLGGGIGFIKKNPKFNTLTVAENGMTPPIFIYSWPALELISTLRQGAKYYYTGLDYSPDGEMLVSQAGDPDYTLTVWNWRDAKIVLKVKSYHNDILNLMISPTVPGQMTTCGKFFKSFGPSRELQFCIFCSRYRSHKVLEDGENFHGLKTSGRRWPLRKDRNQ